MSCLFKNKIFIIRALKKLFKFEPLMGDRKPPLDYCKDTRY